MGNLRFAIIRRLKKKEGVGAGEMVEEIALEYDQDVLLQRLALGIATELVASEKWYRKKHSLEEIDKVVVSVFRGIVDELKAETVRIV